MTSASLNQISNIKYPQIMGILNITPDSFSDGGQFFDLQNAVNRAKEMIEQGVNIIDIGGESTRPGAIEIPIETEISRTIPIIKAIREFSQIPISIDTRKPQIAIEAINAGANIWNDVSGLTFSPDSIEVAAKLDVPIIIMHSQGLPENMQDSPFYHDVISDVLAFLSKQIGLCIAGGVKRNNIIIDPGIGFGKTLENNLDLLAGLNRFKALGTKILLGTSRKSFFGKIDLSATNPIDRLGGSITTAICAADANIEIIRVHDVKPTLQALKVWAAIEARKNI